MGRAACITVTMYQVSKWGLRSEQLEGVLELINLKAWNWENEKAERRDFEI
jgi:hypothetical protein